MSQNLVAELNLKTRPHPHPYKMKWLDNKASGAVNKQCLVNLTLGTYIDEVLCHVLDMDACYLLLRRPWKYDRRTNLDGYTNTYTLRHNGKRKVLVSLPPHKTIPPKEHKQPIHLINRKDCDREVRQKGELYLLFTKEVSDHTPMPSKLKSLINQYTDVFQRTYLHGCHPLGVLNIK